MSDQEHWQLDGSAPELYERYLVPAITSVWATDLVERIAPAATDRVLDIACGTGAVTRLVAERVTAGRIVGLDLNPGMLAIARSLNTHGASRIEWCDGSALELPFPDNSFDLVLCQLGLQFFPDRVVALREMKRVLTPTSRLALSVYSAIERTPGAHAFVEALDRHFGADASRIKRAEHAFSNPEQVRDLIAGEGFHRVNVATVTKPIRFPSVQDYVRFQLVATPMAILLSGLSPHEREDAIEAVAAGMMASLEPAMISDGRLSFPQEAYVAFADRGEE